ncbi:hypothetical protein [Polynucleobacter necessarius]|nr:hypothetical protein [Polynucleobacter necessarius]
MQNNPGQPNENLAEEYKRTQAGRALEEELLEDHEHQGTYRNDQSLL